MRGAFGGVHGSFSPTRMVRRPTDAETLAETNWRHEIRSSAKPAVPSDAAVIPEKPALSREGLVTVGLCD